MDYRISATELVRRLGDVLSRLRYRGHSFLVERRGAVVAPLVPLPGAAGGSVREALTAWRSVGPDVAFAELLERVGAAHPSLDDAGAP